MSPPARTSPFDAVSIRALEFCPEAIIVTTPDLEIPGPTIVYVNRAFERLSGYARNEVMGRNPRFLQGPRTDRAVLDAMRDAAYAGQEFTGEVVNYRKDGSEYLIEWKLAPMRDSQGRLTHWIAVQRDITELRRFELELITHAQQLFRSAQALGDAADGAQEPAPAAAD
jgi:PAS domain S-box-containing protein